MEDEDFDDDMEGEDFDDDVGEEGRISDNEFDLCGGDGVEGTSDEDDAFPFTAEMTKHMCCYNL